MATTRSFLNNDQFGLTDLTPSLKLITPMRTLLGDMGLFADRLVSQDTITIQIQKDNVALIGDVVRGATQYKNSNERRSLIAVNIPHFRLDDAIHSSELRNVAGWNGEATDTLTALRYRKLASMERHWTATHELAKFKAITTGISYAPNGTAPVVDYYTEIGVTRKVVPFALSDNSTNVGDKNEEVIAHIQDNTQTGGTVGEVVKFCSPEYFTAYTNHPSVTVAYSMYQSQQEPLRNRLGGNTTVNRQFYHKGITLIEVRGGYANQLFIPAGEAFAIPMGVEDMFEMYHAPANTFSAVNGIAQKSYAWELPDNSDRFIQFITESNFLPFIRRPQSVVRCVS